MQPQRLHKKTIERAKKTGAEKIGIICLRGTTDKPPTSLEILTPEDVTRIAINTARRAINTTTPNHTTQAHPLQHSGEKNLGTRPKGTSLSGKY